jgi:recombination protein RecA
MAKKKAEFTGGVADLLKEMPQLKSADEDLYSFSNVLYPSGCYPLDIVMGGGVACGGKMVELKGWESSGKTTFALMKAAAFVRHWQAQNQECLVVWIECESALDQDRLENMYPGILEYFRIFEAETVEDANEITVDVLKKAIAAGIKVMFVWDSLAAASIRSELEGNSSMIEKPKLIKKFFREITTLLGKCDAPFVIVNHIIGGPGVQPWEEPTSPGGGGPRFHCSVRTELKKVTMLKKTLMNGKEVAYGQVTRMKTWKNKLTLPHQEVEVVLKGETGIHVDETNYRYLEQNKLFSTGGWKHMVIPSDVFKNNKDIVLPDIKVDKDGYSRFEWKFDSDKNVSTPGWTKLKWQNPSKFFAYKEELYGHLEQWIKYLIFRSYSEVSPTFKIKLIGELWALEEMFLGVRLTKVLASEKKRIGLAHPKLKIKKEDLVEDPSDV